MCCFLCFDMQFKSETCIIYQDCQNFISFIYGKIFMAHDIFPFVNVFVVTNILTRNYHEFLYFFSLSQYIIQSMIFYNSQCII